MPNISFYEKMVLIIDNTRRRLRRDLRNEYLKRAIPCALSDLEHSAEYMPCMTVQVTEEYLMEEAAFIAALHGSADVICSERALSFELPEREHISLSEKGAVYCSKGIYLTKTERLIVSMLMFVQNAWISSELVCAYCMKVSSNTSAVRTHISNINRKALSATGNLLVDCRRFVGYRLHIFK